MIEFKISAMFKLFQYSQWRTQEKNFGGGFKVLAGLVGGPGGADAGEFSKICKKFSEENCKKCTILAYFSKNLRNHALIFKRVWTKTQILGNF